MPELSYRFVILILLCVGFILSFGLRSAFIMTVTHTSRLHTPPNDAVDLEDITDMEFSESDFDLTLEAVPAPVTRKATRSIDEKSNGNSAYDEQGRPKNRDPSLMRSDSFPMNLSSETASSDIGAFITDIRASFQEEFHGNGTQDLQINIKTEMTDIHQHISDASVINTALNLSLADTVVTTQNTNHRKASADVEQGNDVSLGETGFYQGCTVYNTSRDFQSSYSWGETLQFYTVYYVGRSIASFSGGYIVSKMRPYILLTTGWYAYGGIYLLMPTLLHISATAVTAVRFVVGFVEGLLIPPAVVLTKDWAFSNEKSRFLSVVLIGYYLSPALANVFVGACLCYISWDSSLYIISGSILALSLLWNLFGHESPLQCPRVSNSDKKRYNRERCSKELKAQTKLYVPWGKILTSLPVWAIWVATTNKNCNLVVTTLLMPLFFKDVFGIRAADSGLLLVAPFVSNCACVLLSSHISDWLINSGTLSVTSARKLMQCTGAAGEAIFLLAVIYSPNWKYAIASLTMSYAMGGVCFPGYGCNVMDLSSRYSGVIFAISSTGYILVAFTTNITSLIPESGQIGGMDKWTFVILVNSGIAAFSSVFYLFFASGEKQEWGGDEPVHELICGNDDDEDDDDTIDTDREHVRLLDVKQSTTSSSDSWEDNEYEHNFSKLTPAAVQ